MPEALTHIRGRALGQTKTGQLTSQGIALTPAAMDATVTVSDEATNVVTITIQLLDAHGNDIDSVEMVDLFMFDDATGTTAASVSPSTGLAAGTDGAIISTVTAHKHYVLTSESDGDIDLTFTDTGADTTYVAVRLGNGRLVFGDQAITTA